MLRSNEGYKARVGVRSNLVGLKVSKAHRGIRSGVAQGGLISPFLFSRHDNELPPPSHHVDLALYADDTAIIATSHNSTLLVSYLESYLN